MPTIYTSVEGSVMVKMSLTGNERKCTHIYAALCVPEVYVAMGIDVRNMDKFAFIHSTETGTRRIISW